MRKPTRQAMTMVEVMVIGSVGLLVVSVVLALLSAAWRQDTWTGGRLDAITAIGATLDSLRHDLYHADAAQTDPTGNRLALHVVRPDNTPETTIYAWQGAAKPLTRNEKPVGFAKPLDCGVTIEEDVPVFSLQVPSSQLPGQPAHESTLSVPLVIPESYWQQRIDYWAPRAD